MKTQLEERLQRTIALLGKEKAERVFGASVMVIGCGAVGGYALEMVARLGFGKIRAVDFDRFEASNINRQILATISTIGCKKCEAACERVREINPDAEVRGLDIRITADNLDFIRNENPDVVIDAIDDVQAKCSLAAFWRETAFALCRQWELRLRQSLRCCGQRRLTRRKAARWQRKCAITCGGKALI